MYIIFATLTWPENPADAISEVLNSKIFLGGMPPDPPKCVLPHANFPHIVQHHICWPTCAQATTLFWLRHCTESLSPPLLTTLSEHPYRVPRTTLDYEMWEPSQLSPLLWKSICIHSRSVSKDCKWWLHELAFALLCMKSCPLQLGKDVLQLLEMPDVWGFHPWPFPTTLCLEYW